MDIEITISIGEGDGRRGRYSACMVPNVNRQTVRKLTKK